MASFDYVLQAMNSYVDGVGKLGSTEKCSTPKIEKVLEKFRGGGMLGTRQIALGYKEFEWEVDFNSYDPQIIRQCGLFSKKSITLSNTAALDGDGGAEHAANLICRGQFMSVDPGSWEGGKKATLKVKAALDALKLTIDNVTIYDIDVQADKYIIGGVDEYAWIRNAL
jgi:P2 family phage contractile tail tube protein